MVAEEKPAAVGLTPELFLLDPIWSRQAFAYRLLHTLVPPAITRRLPKFLRKGLVFPGVTIPPGVDIPPGVIVPPGAVFPPGWTPGDPAPPGVVIPPGTVFPPGWTPGDPAPPGVVIPPGTVFPPGWTPGDPLPETVSPPPAETVPVPPAGAIPPTYTEPWEPGPIKIIPPSIAIPTTTVDIVSSIADGWVYQYDLDWNVVHDATTGYEALDDSLKDAGAMQAFSETWGKLIQRSFFYFDLSGLPAGATILSCQLRIAGFGWADGWVSAQEGTQADALTVDDFDAFAGDSFGTTEWELWVGIDVAINEIDFSAGGISYIQSVLGGTAKICCREHTHDYMDLSVGPPVVSHKNGCHYANSVTEAYRPVLRIEHTVPEE